MTEPPRDAGKQAPTEAKRYGGQRIRYGRNEVTTPRPDKWVQGVSPDDRTTDVAARTLQAWLAAVLHYLPLAAEKAEEDVEYVHLLRVWTRPHTRNPIPCVAKTVASC